MSTNTIESATDQIIRLPLSEIYVNPYQPRKIFQPNELEELAQSIQTVGLIHPPLVRLTQEGHYELVSGERRFQACKLAGLDVITVHVKASTSCNSAQMALIENIQRVDLNPIEIARALRRLLDEFHLSQEELSLRIGKKRSTVANYLRLLTLPTTIQQSVLEDHITMGHAKAILALEGNDKQALLHELILRDFMSVREAEEAALRLNNKAKRKTLVYRDRDFFLEELAEKIQHKLGTKVFIVGKGKRGRISIDYYNLDDLDRLLAIFLGANHQI